MEIKTITPFKSNDEVSVKVSGNSASSLSLGAIHLREVANQAASGGDACNVSSRAEKRPMSYRFAVLPYISKHESPADDCVAFGALAVDAVNPCFAADVVLGFGPGNARI
ncbi:hypothetical protein [Rhizobium leguminosarum]|uniref:hypothetical protein n=1 Tax=Rhizobium leguminosarum TaxID=384 RepID=UPI0024A8A58A|nr:hypothetical protein [Rhizobium leguminosarum]MDI5930217.1 hypothetical protein [Rhizobium leguminosarum]